MKSVYCAIKISFMECTDFNRHIDEYLSEALTDEELNDFLHHLKFCKNCREELEINYIVKKGIDEINENSSDYDLYNRFVESEVRNAEFLKHRKLMLRISYIVDTVAFWLVLACVFIFLRICF